MAGKAPAAVMATAQGPAVATRDNPIVIDDSDDEESGPTANKAGVAREVEQTDRPVDKGQGKGQDPGPSLGPDAPASASDGSTVANVASGHDAGDIAPATDETDNVCTGSLSAELLETRVELRRLNEFLGVEKDIRKSLLRKEVRGIKQVVATAVGSTVGGILPQVIPEAVREGVSEEILTACRNAVGEEVQEAMRQGVAKEMRWAIRSVLSDEARVTLRKEIREAVREVMREERNAQAAQQDEPPATA